MHQPFTSFYRRHRPLIIRTVLLLGFLALWELGTDRDGLTFRYTSSPSAIAADTVEFIRSGAFAKHAGVTLQEALLGLGIGSSVGILTAVLCAQWRLLGQVLKPVVHAINTIPQLTLAPVYILWFGIDLKSKVFLTSLMVFFQLFFATFGAIEELDHHLIDAAELLGSDRLTTVRRVILPSTAPWLLIGFRNGISAALVGAIIGEYMGASAGFGWMIAYASSYFDITRVMTCILMLMLTGILLNRFINGLEKRLFKWRGAVRTAHSDSFKPSKLIYKEKKHDQPIH